MAKDPEKKMKRCPRCGKDMPIGGVCEACEFDDDAAESAAWNRAYVNRRVKQIEEEMDKAAKKANRGSEFKIED